MAVLAIRASRAWLGPGRTVEDALVVVDGGRIAFAGAERELGVLASDGPRVERLGGEAVPPEPDEEVTFDGFLMPGVADRHVHVGLSDPMAVLLGGVTAVRDLGWIAEEIFSLADASEGPSFNGPLVRAAGPILTCPGGYPTRAAWAPEGVGRPLAGAEEAVAAVADLAGRGAAVIKAALNSDAGPTLPDATLVAICDAAHAAGLRVTVHCQGAGEVERALGAGVDELAHCPWSEELPASVIDALARRVRIVSTLDIHVHGSQSDDPQALRRALSNLTRFIQAGGRVVYGTDLGNGSIPPGIHADEARHLINAGLTPDQTLTAMTAGPLALGTPADLVALGADPLADLSALGEIRAVFRQGLPVR